MTKIAYDERNIYVMEYLQKVMDKENERADKPELSPELQSHQLHQWGWSLSWEHSEPSILY